MKKIIAVVALMMLVAGAAFFVVPRSKTGPVQSGDVRVVLTPDGFAPETIRIHAGTQVTFTTTTGKFFWPASDLHPSHGIYPAFDPKKPLEATASWSFTFDREGSWEYHDHLSPYYTGSITVVP